MSKLQASSVRTSVKTVLAQSGEETYKEAGGKKRNFTETIELQVGLKNYDPQRDKRFVRLCLCSHHLVDVECADGCADGLFFLAVWDCPTSSYPEAEDAALYPC